MRVAINGFGRIGRLALRCMLSHKNIEVVAINDIVPSDNLAYLFTYDTTHGRFCGEVASDEGHIIINGKKIKTFSEKDPLNLPWKALQVDYVIESSGHFTTLEGASKHIQAGCKRVLISAPAKEGVPTFVMGVNETKYDPVKDVVISNASCTTNCLAPICKVLLDTCGIEEGLMTTIHATTASQPTVDGPSKKDWRGGRAAFQNIIPSSTGAAKAVALCLPELKGKLTGMAFRVPIADVSCVDLTVKTSKATSYEAICQAMQAAASGAMKGILDVTGDEVVSSDFIGSKASAVFDMKAGIGLNSTFFKLVAWYDNEMGYAQRCVDFLEYMNSKE